ncbi:5-(carboxyamino)imidazole ribonucleotide mutase [Sandaracinobacteroides sp. A072]|uniref:5-(carboxyamino)imidazole ribonucleotide mutase n=1 Tax=Sandaracinobacteroides sp. A072 TaxID=3461146 RepID=UPI00404171CD
MSEQKTDHETGAGTAEAVQVGIIMGSVSDWETMRHAAETLAALDVPHEVKIVSAHRTPRRMVDYADSAEARGIRVIVAGAGGAAHLPGMVASLTSLPVLGVPVQSKALNGMDSLLSIAQMPAGIPVGTLAIGKAGATNAGLLAAAILATTDPALSARLKAWRQRQTDAVADAP